ncbi:hypothetical protein HDU89_001139 [Geranomyces variabilis]|nr:hypothetical protein HDU89_001139 [Geranomyces variabilis]
MLLSLDTVVYLARFHLDDTVALSSLVAASKTLRNALLLPTLVHAVLLRKFGNQALNSFLWQILDPFSALAFCSLPLRVELAKLFFLDTAAGRISYDLDNIRWYKGSLLRGLWRSSVLPFALKNVPQFRESLKRNRRTAVMAVDQNFNIEQVQCLIDAQCFDLPTGLAKAVAMADERLVIFLLQLQPAGIPSGYWPCNRWHRHDRSLTSEQKISMVDLLIDAHTPLPEAFLDSVIDDLPVLQHVLDRWNGRRPVGAALLSRSLGVACKTGRVDAIKMLVSHGASLSTAFHTIEEDLYDDQHYDDEHFRDPPETPLEAALERNQHEVVHFLGESGVRFTGDERELCLAAANCETSLLQLVLDKGRHKPTRDAVDSACRARRLENVRLLVQAGLQSRCFTLMTRQGEPSIVAKDCIRAALDNNDPDFCRHLGEDFWPRLKPGALARLKGYCSIATKVMAYLREEVGRDDLFEAVA